MPLSLRCASVTHPQALAVLLPMRSTPLSVGALLKKLDEPTRTAITVFLKRKEFTGERGTISTLYPDKGCDRVWVVGLGEVAKLDAGTWLLAGAKLAQAALNAGISSLAIRLPDDLTHTVQTQFTAEQIGRLIGDGLGLGRFEFKQFKGAAGKNSSSDQTKSSTQAKAMQPGSPVVLTVDMDKPFVEGLTRALTIVPSVDLARRLAATPPNIANPQFLAQQVRSMARKVGLSCRILDAKALRKLGMNALLAVGGAGSTPPCLIVLEWKGTDSTRGQKASNKPVLLVGKAVTFDTGGYSLKPAESMPAMKYDKCGGMVVLGVMHALAQLKYPGHVVGLVPCAENMVGPTAYRPADILRACNGVTIEVTNTDAEGRLILADALAWGCKTYQPRVAVDLATLTGGVVVGLGTHVAGMFTTHDSLRDRLQQAGAASGERLWPLPLWEEYRQQIKGTHGDIVNAAGREGSPCTGAAFISYFVSADGTGDAMSNPPTDGWAHLDIAGVSDFARAGNLYPPGPTGFGVRLLLRWLEEKVK